MKDGFVKIKTISPEIELGNPSYNKELIIDEMLKAQKEGVQILVFPELCLCGATLGDYAYNEAMLKGCENALEQIISVTKPSPLTFIGLPVAYHSQVYSTVAVVKDGELLCLVPKRTSIKGANMPDKTHCDYADNTFSIDEYAGCFSPINGAVLVHRCEELENLAVGCEIGIDSRIGGELVANGATIIVNPCACKETVTSERELVEYAKTKSKRLNCGYVICNPATSESTSQAVYSAHNIICENGDVLAESKPFESKNGECVSEIDVNYLANKRRALGVNMGWDNRLYGAYFKVDTELETALTRKINPYPFLEENEDVLWEKCDKIFKMESVALARRLKTSRSRCMVIGISGGLDSTLALITCVKCAEELGWDREKIIAVTMPCFGTTKRTKNNATELCTSLGVTLKEVDITKAVTVHLSDIGHSLEDKSVTYENAQARERTQVLMDIANREGGIVIGTGDMSEGALGWSTYNGDQMSMYNVNASIPKTLVRKMVERACEYFGSPTCDILRDVLATPVSPELLPHKDGEIQQKTEDLVGPYDLHDFFLYNFVGRGFPPSKVHRLANVAFLGIYDSNTIYKWLEIFIKRYFSQHFKRSCSPDSIALGSVSLGKGELSMPGDMSCRMYLEELKSVLDPEDED
ncbi:MAG: NAD(+) synthase [Clostridia bacterium]|nr:NAD(+) synthase [Clostridia bacterium]